MATLRLQGEGGYHPRKQTSNPRHPSVDFYHSPVAVWVNSAPQPKRWGPRAHRGRGFQETCELNKNLLENTEFIISGFLAGILWDLTGMHSDNEWIVPSQHPVNLLRPAHNGYHLENSIFKCIFLNENVQISIRLSLEFVTEGPIYNNSALVQGMACCWLGDKPLLEPTSADL